MMTFFGNWRWAFGSIFSVLVAVTAGYVLKNKLLLPSSSKSYIKGGASFQVIRPLKSAHKKGEKHKIRLVYFNGRGRAEITRILLAIAGLEYEDVRVDHEVFVELRQKGKLAFNQLPMMEYDDEVIVQSMAINRFLAHQHGMYGKSIEEMAQIDVVVEGCIDLESKYTQAHAVPRDQVLDRLQAFSKTVLPQWLEYFTKILEKNNEGHAFFVGDSVSLADVVMYGLLLHLRTECFQVVKQFVKLSEFMRRIENIPAVSAWIKQRPATPF